MIRIESNEKCSGCHACANACPVSCIAMVRDSEGFLYPQVNAEACVDCRICENVCPLASGDSSLDSEEPEEETLPHAYAAVNRDEAVRSDSSSGGIFTLLAEAVLEDGGAVFGAAFDGALGVYHIAVENREALSRLRGSKYLQSRIEDTYRRAKEMLDSGRTVLYTGTPCQIGGLRAYLRKDYPNLICQDIICHGVPAPSVWERYLAFREEAAVSKARNVSFRSKKTGWNDYSVEIGFENGAVYAVHHEKDPYIKAFLADLCLRPSCYACRFKGVSRESDITLADFWGIQNVLPEWSDNKGVSLVFVHTERGKKLFERIKDQTVRQAVNVSEAVKYNPSMTRSARRPKSREAFLRDISHMPFDKAVKKHTRVPFLQKCKRVLKKILK